MIPIVYHPEYVSPLPLGHRFPMAKFAALHSILRAERILTDENVRVPQRAEDADLMLVHDADYVRSFTKGTLPARELRRIGLPWSSSLVARTKRAVGGTLLTARLALRHGIALNTAGGTHHAHPSYGSGFCIFNDLAVTARRLLQEGTVTHVLIVDLDVHQGDGTLASFRDDPRVTCLDVHCGENFPFRKQSTGINRSVPVGMTDDAYLTEVGAALEHALTVRRPDLALYDAGVDVFHGDRLGKLSLTRDGIERRDRLVLSRLNALGIPVAAVIGGGYQNDLHRLAHLHATLHRVAVALETPEVPETP
ncbi:MAG: histone deacetylase [Alkalispirochaeta sp.]